MRRRLVHLTRSAILGALLVAGVAAAAAGSAHAQVRMSDTLTARQACPATTSIRGSQGVPLEPGQHYQVVGKNRPDATFLQIVISGERRWVAIGCGELASAGAAPSGGNAPTPTAATPGVRASYVFAISWEPAFCRGHGGRPECDPRQPGAGGRQMSLHGLWPQPRGTAYCGLAPDVVAADRAHDWRALPEPSIAPGTRQRLGAVMPGLQSGLERHEWAVHGTCSGLTADAYFARAADLTAEINGSAIPALFARSAGRTLSADAIRAAFDQAFGPGAGSRVLVSCSRGAREIQELDISLAGEVTGTTPLADLIRAAAPVPPGCPVGTVVPPAG